MNDLTVLTTAGEGHTELGRGCVLATHAPEINFSWSRASQHIRLAFQKRHFSPTSAAAVRFLVKGNPFGEPRRGRLDIQLWWYIVGYSIDRSRSIASALDLFSVAARIKGSWRSEYYAE